MLLIRGIIAILFGLLAFTWPGLTLVVLTALFAAYAFVDGIVAMTVGFHSRWWSLVFLGLLGVLAGLVAFFYPGMTALTLLYLIGAWAFIRGIIEIAAAIQLRKVISNEWALILGGICSILFGIILFARPGVGILAVIWIIGVYALIIGIFLVSLSFKLKSHQARVAMA